MCLLFAALATLLIPQGTSFKAWQSWTFPGSAFNTFSIRRAKVLYSFPPYPLFKDSSKDPPLSFSYNVSFVKICFKLFLRSLKAMLAHRALNVRLFY